MKEYAIRKKNGTSIDWDAYEKAEIDTYSWMDNGYAPRVCAALCYDAEAIYIKFWAYETEIRGTYHKHNDNVFEDSCVEFFFRPNSNPNYFNIETNVLGAQLIGFGPARENRERVNVDDVVMQIQPSVKDADNYKDNVWTMEYCVPFSFMKKYYGDMDIISDGLRANLFKCGDFTKFEHYGMWSPVEIESPDFHKPEFFGSMTFEK